MSEKAVEDKRTAGTGKTKIPISEWTVHVEWCVHEKARKEI